jgi:hypothetical protein
MTQDNDIAIFTAEIEGRPVVAFSEEDPPDEGETWDNVSDFDTIRNELLLMSEPSGRPLWDGETPITVRPATSEERSRWQTSLADAVRDGTQDKGNADWAVYLVPCVPFDHGEDEDE